MCLLRMVWFSGVVCHFSQFWNIGLKESKGTWHKEDPVGMLSKSEDDGDFLERANKQDADVKIQKEIHWQDNELNTGKRKKQR